MEKLTTFQSKIESVAKKFKNTEYFYGNWKQVDKFLDDHDSGNYFQRPVICHILPPSGTLTPKRGATLWQDKPSTLIAFLMPTDLDFDGVENEDKVELMKSLAKMFVQALNKSGLFEQIDEEEIPYQVPYDTTDDNLTGVLVTFTIKELTGSPVCSIDGFGYDPNA